MRVGARYGVNVIVTDNRVGVVGDVRNVGNVSEEVRSKVWAMTNTVSTMTYLCSNSRVMNAS